MNQEINVAIDKLLAAHLEFLSVAEDELTQASIEYYGARTELVQKIEKLAKGTP